MISACMTVSVRELRTAVREWACWQPMSGAAVSGRYASADPEGGTGGLDPPWKITSYIGFYRE